MNKLLYIHTMDVAIKRNINCYRVISKICYSAEKSKIQNNIFGMLHFYLRKGKYVNISIHICLLFKNRRIKQGTSLVVQWLGCHAPNEGGLGSIPGQGAGSHMPQLRVHTPQRGSHMPQLGPRVPKLGPGAAK